MTQSTPRRKVALFGVFGAGNLGNESTLQAMLFHLRKCVPQADILCVCSNPAEVTSTYHVPAVSIREAPLPPLKNRFARLLRRVVVGVPVEIGRWLKAFRALSGVDALIMTGTGMLGDVGIGPFGLHYDILKWSLVAKLRRCELLFVSVGVGPLSNPMSKRFVKAVLALADYRSYRDIFSKQYLKELHFKAPNDHVCPDLAFSLPAGIMPSAAPVRGAQKPIVAVGIITYSNLRENSGSDSAYREYIARLSAFISWLRSHDYPVRLLIGDAVHDHRARLDLRSSLEAHGLMYGDGQILDEPASSVEQVISQLASAAIVVASRFHNVLLALWLNKPVLAISFHEKVDSLMEAVGLGAFRQDINQIDVEQMAEQFLLLERTADAVKAQIKQKADGYRIALDEQYERIFSML
jgi:polysaccharide pyruvyl transferase WcaK-like protein